MPKFTLQQYKEIEESRARLEAFKNKIQPYPALPVEPESPQVEPIWHHRQWDKVQQIQSEVEGWRKKHAESLLAIDKLTKQISGGGDLV